jgi:hypothetical protein
MLVSILAGLARRPESIQSQDEGLSIAGRVTKLNVNFPCIVRLYERSTGRQIAQTHTDSSGNYQFKHLQNGYEFTLVAHDHQRQYNAVIQDMVKPV